MSELLTALVAASKVGFDTPRCGRCRGSGRMSQWQELANPLLDPPCPHCHATGLDASDPERLIGRAEGWLLVCEHYPSLQNYPTSACFRVHDKDGAMAELFESYDRTAESRATALLRLVARVGGAQ